MNFKLEQQMQKIRMNWPFTVNHLSSQAVGLEVWYPCFNVVNGPKIYDLVGGYHASSNTANINWSPARPFGFIVPKLSGQGLDTGYSKALQDFTISCWFYSTGQDNVFDRVFDKSFPTAMTLFLNDAGIAEYKGIINGNFSSGITIPFFQPHFVVLRRIGGTGSVIVDGGKTISSWSVGTSPTNSDTNLVIGSNPGFSNTFGGDLWDFRVYNRGLSDSEILAMYHQDTRFDLLAPMGVEVLGSGIVVPITAKSQVIWFN